MTDSRGGERGTALPSDPIAMLNELQQAGAGLTAAAADAYMAEVRVARKTWRSKGLVLSPAI